MRLGAFAWSQQWAPTLAQLPPLVLLATSQVGAQVAGTLLTKELELVGASLLGTLGLEEEWFPRLQLGHCWVPPATAASHVQRHHQWWLPLRASVQGVIRCISALAAAKVKAICIPQRKHMPFKGVGMAFTQDPWGPSAFSSH